VLAPPDEIRGRLSISDPEAQLDAFRDWFRWRSRMPDDRRPAADAFLARSEWIDLLGNVALYDMSSDERRLHSYKLLAQIGGQDVFPFFLWGITDNDEHGPPGYIQDFFEAHGDTTVIEHLPGNFRWQKVIDKINNRWSGRDPPDKKWNPIDSQTFVSDLTDKSAVRRRLAVRAVTVNRGLERAAICRAMRDLLDDTNRDVRRVTLESLTIVACPALRGRLKSLAEDPKERIVHRQLAVHAVMACGADIEWTAEWMLDNLPGWPEQMDATITQCLIRMHPRESAEKPRYQRFLRECLKQSRNPRTKAVLENALKSV
jgi:hypothetical protein